MKALIGYTGYVGSTLLAQAQFDDLYNSKNISEIRGKSYSLVICAGAPAVKWKANQNPEEDLANINMLISHLKEVKADKFILISTVDVYQKPDLVNESTVINPQETDPYGKHRFFLEQFVESNFKDSLIIRLPGLFGKGLKKNFIYDLIHDNCLHLTHRDSVFQFYDMSDLWDHINVCIKMDLKLVNFSPEPVTASELAHQSADCEFTNVTDKPPVYYDMRSLYNHVFHADPSGEYMYPKQVVFNKIRQFIKQELIQKENGAAK